MGYKRVEITGPGDAKVIRVVEAPYLPDPVSGEVRIWVEGPFAGVS